jgi:hypothetical protein
MTRKEKIYKIFLENFPNFEPLVKSYRAEGPSSIRIETKNGKAFIFKNGSDGISLSAV